VVYGDGASTDTFVLGNAPGARPRPPGLVKGLPWTVRG
jgi:hypothetical protein